MNSKFIFILFILDSRIIRNIYFILTYSKDILINTEHFGVRVVYNQLKMSQSPLNHISK